MHALIQKSHSCTSHFNDLSIQLQTDGPKVCKLQKVACKCELCVCAQRCYLAKPDESSSPSLPARLPAWDQGTEIVFVTEHPAGHLSHTVPNMLGWRCWCVPSPRCCAVQFTATTYQAPSLWISLKRIITFGFQIMSYSINKVINPPYRKRLSPPFVSGLNSHHSNVWKHYYTVGLKW